MLECPRSPSTSLASSGRETGSSGKEHGVASGSVERLNESNENSPKKRGVCGLAAKRLIRVPCGKATFTTDSTVPSSVIPFTVFGGAAAARLILVDIVKREDLIGILSPNDIILKIEDVQVSGMLRTEVTRLLERLCHENDQIAIEIIPAGAITDDICEILGDKQWADLQTVIRDNLYSKTVPYTTRPPRDGEIDGEHYRFVSVEEFKRLQTEGLLLEHGTYQGHLYGTPRPEECYESAAMVSCSNKGPLPPNWEIGYAENGDKYFIDHNSGTTTWEDPRDLPPGWEQVDDPEYGTFFVDHINKRTQYERPGTSTTMSRYDALPTTATHKSNGIISNGHQPSPPHQQRPKQPSIAQTSQNGGNPFFTRDPQQLRGEMVTTTIVKGPKGLGFTLIGNDASSKGNEFIQVKSILPGGLAAEDGVLQPGDVLVRVNGELLLGASQSDACRIFVNIPVGDPVAIQVCRGYPLLLDPSNRIITENVYQTGGRSRDLHEIEIIKGSEGFGFTIADSATGQRVKKILYPEQCANLLEGDTIVELDGRNVRAIPHTQLVDMLRECPVGHRGRLVVRRSSPKHRSRTPAAEFRYGEQGRANTQPTVSPRSKTPAPLTHRQESDPNMPTTRAQTLQRQPNVTPSSDAWDGPSAVGSRMRPSSTTLGFATPNYMPISAFQFNKPSDLITVNLIRKPNGFGFRLLGGSETSTQLTVGQVVPGGAAADDGRMQEGDEIIEIDGRNVEGVSHVEAVSLLEQAAHSRHVKLVVRRPRSDALRRQSVHAERPLSGMPTVNSGEYDVTLTRNETDGFGFIIISSLNRNGSTIGQILENSPAEKCGRLKVGDRVVAVNGIDILNLTHGEIVGLIKASGLTVRLTIAPPMQDGGPLASSTLNRSVIPNSYISSPPATFVPPPPTFQNGGYYATLGRNANYSSFPPPVMTTSMPFSYTNGSTIRTSSNYTSYPETSRPIYTTSHLNGQLNGMSLHNPVPPEQDSPIISVELERGARGFGFSIRGGQEFGAMPLFVLRIAEDGPAAIDGRLKVGDQLISINGRDTKGLTHEEAIQLIKQHPSVRLTVRRHKLP
uniref:Membrane associated guanylate kinase, WW and PDZ domain containing 3 n=1 Tax=Haemonchus contortus TaxID=6289 RepID=A0A7I4YLN5_HAECO